MTNLRKPISLFLMVLLLAPKGITLVFFFLLPSRTSNGILTLTAVQCLILWTVELIRGKYFKQKLIDTKKDFIESGGTQVLILSNLYLYTYIFFCEV